MFQELRCSPDDCSLHQLWLMFTFAVRNGKESSQLTADKNSVFIIGRRVSALVVKHVQDVQTCLRLVFLPKVVYTLRCQKVASQFRGFDTFAWMVSLENGNSFTRFVQGVSSPCFPTC